MEEEVKQLAGYDKRNFIRGTSRFKGEHGMYLLFCSEIIGNVARDAKLTVRETQILLFAYYVSKYIAYSAALYADLISVISKEVKFNYTSQEIRKLLPKLYDLKLVNKYGDVYVINRDTQDWVKMFTNQLTYKLHNFNRVGFYDSLKTKRGMLLQDRKKLERRARIAKRIEEAKKTGNKYTL